MKEKFLIKIENKISILKELCDFDLEKDNIFILRKDKKALRLEVNEDQTITIESNKDIYRNINEQYIPDFVIQFFQTGILYRDILNNELFTLEKLPSVESPDFALSAYDLIVKAHKSFVSNTGATMNKKIAEGNRAYISYCNGSIVLEDDLLMLASNIIEYDDNILKKLI